MKTMTIRNVSPELAQALDKERRKRGVSLNRTVLALLRNALGVPNQAVRSNGLHELAGTWSEAEYQQFEHAVAALGEVDEAMWRDHVNACTVLTRPSQYARVTALAPHVHQDQEGSHESKNRLDCSV